MKIFDRYRDRVSARFIRVIEKPVVRSADFCERHPVWIVLILLLIGTGLRIGYTGMIDHMDRDEYTYIARVEQAAAEGFETLSPNSQRLMIYSGMLLKKAGVDAAAGMRSFNIACSFLWLLMMFFLGRAVFRSAGAGLLALALAAFEPYTIRISGMVLRESLHLLLFSCGMFCAIQIIRGARLLLFSVLLGIVSALAAWSRLEGLEMLAWMPLALFFYFIRSKRELPTRRILTAAALYLGSLALAWMLVIAASPGYIHGVSLKVQAIIHRWGC